MDPRINPYAPGAGTPPPELAGRDAVLADAHLAVQRNKSGRSARSFMFVGLRGVGKTVLRIEVQIMADEKGTLTDFIEQMVMELERPDRYPEGGPNDLSTPALGSPAAVGAVDAG